MGQALWSSDGYPTLELSEVPSIRNSTTSSSCRPTRTISELAAHDRRWERLLQDEDGLFTGAEIIDQLYGQHLLEMIEIMERYNCSFNQAAVLAATGNGEDLEYEVVCPVVDCFLGGGPIMPLDSCRHPRRSSKTNAGVGDYLKVRRAGFPLFQALIYGLQTGDGACSLELCTFRRAEARDALTRCQLTIRLVEGTLQKRSKCTAQEVLELESLLLEARALCFRLDYAITIMEASARASGEEPCSLAEYPELLQIAVHRNARLLELTEELRDLRRPGARLLASMAMCFCIPEEESCKSLDCGRFKKEVINFGPSRSPADVHQRGALLREYSVGQTIGEGAYGVVASCRSRSTGKEFAVKMIDKVETPVETIVQEIEVLQNIDHTNVVQFVGVFHEKCFVCIVMNRYAGGDLVRGIKRHYEDHGQISCYESVHIMRQMSAGVWYLHSRSIIHRDIKGDNFLMDRDDLLDPSCSVALSDFGTARWASERDRFSDAVGTKMLWAPEMFDGNYGLKVDVWATGVVLFGLLSGHFPFMSESEIRSSSPELLPQVDPLCQGLVKSMLQKREGDRLSAEQVTSHQWFDGVKNRLLNRMPSQLRACMTVDLHVDETNINVQTRRQELIDRLTREHDELKGVSERGHAGLGRQGRHRFCVGDGGVETWYEWWDSVKCKQRGVEAPWEFSAPCRQPWVSDALDAVRLDTFTRMLKEHNIDTSKFGHQSAGSVERLADEVQRGTAELLLDASEHKKLVRVVNIVVLLLYPSKVTMFNPTSLTSMKRGSRRSSKSSAVGQSYILVQRQERFANGVCRERLGLPASKKEPWENTRQTAERVVREKLNLSNASVRLDLEKVGLDELHRESQSYPGLQTVYRQEFVQGRIVAELERAGLPNLEDWGVEDDNGGSRLFSWMTELQAVASGAKLWPDEGGGGGLVKAPVGLTEAELGHFLTTRGVDVSRFGSNGAKTLREFSDELLKGEASLVHDKQAALVVRMVNLVVVFLERRSSGKALVRSSGRRRVGSSRSALGRRFSDAGSAESPLPGIVGRPDENHFHSARRLLCGQLLFDENAIFFEQEVQDVEEVESLPDYPGLRSVYRRRLVRASLLEEEGSSPSWTSFLPPCGC